MGNNVSLAELSRRRKQEKKQAVEAENNTNPVPVVEQPDSSYTSTESSSVETEIVSSDEKTKNKGGRPRGIRSNPDYAPTTLHLNKLNKAKIRFILDTEKDSDPELLREGISDIQSLVNYLLEDWLNSRK